MEKFTPDANFRFIRERIYRLHNAIMYSLSNELIKIPNSIITVLRIDESGHLWFRCNAPAQYINQCEESFPVRLHFFRKGYEYFLEVSGAATIVRGKQNDCLGEDRDEKNLLMKVDINCVEYVEPHAKRKSWPEQFVENSYNWLLRLLTIPQGVKAYLR